MKILKFSATWCQPCQTLRTIIENAGDKITIPIEDIDIDQNLDLARQYRIRGVPFLVLLDDNNNVVRDMYGVSGEEDLLGFING